VKEIPGSVVSGTTCIHTHPVYTHTLYTHTHSLQLCISDQIHVSVFYLVEELNPEYNAHGFERSLLAASATL